MEHWFTVIGLIVIYLLPTIFAYYRNHSSKYAIMFINIFAGWTVFGWLYALVWSIASKGQNITIINQVKE